MNIINLLSDTAGRTTLPAKVAPHGRLDIHVYNDRSFSWLVSDLRDVLPVLAGPFELDFDDYHLGAKRQIRIPVSEIDRVLREAGF